MSKRRLYFHVILIVIMVALGSYSLWKDGLISEGKNFPNITALSMAFLLIAQIIRIVRERKEEN
jgi:hypothetical protein